MNPSSSLLLLLSLAASLGVGTVHAASHPDASPVCAISEKVRVSVGSALSLIDGHFWLQYVEARDLDHQSTIWFRYPLFVPRGETDFVDLVELTQLKVSIGGFSFPPKSVEVDDPAAIQWVHPVPDDATIAWFMFDLPREVAKTRFEVVITYAQPHYSHKDQSIAAWMPWMPDFIRYKMKLENFEVRFEAMPGVSFEPAAPNEHMLESSSTLLVVRPVHRENVAVTVRPASGT